jgi:hypothetical protein
LALAAKKINVTINKGTTRFISISVLIDEINIMIERAKIVKIKCFVKKK